MGSTLRSWLPSFTWQNVSSTAAHMPPWFSPASWILLFSLCKPSSYLRLLNVLALGWSLHFLLYSNHTHFLGDLIQPWIITSHYILVVLISPILLNIKLVSLIHFIHLNSRLIYPTTASLTSLFRNQLGISNSTSKPEHLMTSLPYADFLQTLPST